MYQEEDDYGQLPYGQDSMSQPKASTLTAAKDNRRRVELDCQLLANRIALLKQEHAKALYVFYF